MAIEVSVREKGGEPGGGGRGFVGDEGGITVDDLLFVKRLSVPGAFLGVIRGEIGEELQDAHPLIWSR